MRSARAQRIARLLLFKVVVLAATVALLAIL